MHSSEYARMHPHVSGLANHWIVLTFSQNMMSCVFASMHKEQKKVRVWKLFVDHPGPGYFMPDG